MPPLIDVNSVVQLLVDDELAAEASFLFTSGVRGTPSFFPGVGAVGMEHEAGLYFWPLLFMYSEGCLLSLV